MKTAPSVLIYGFTMTIIYIYEHDKLQFFIIKHDI
ncbi:hypothetical protein MB9_2175 [Methanobacterium formicicum]|uniref:Secreted protein n=1 Tax=Methanobacterium formicicum TaxID=2162 RepID=A0A0S4FRU6_METFO|nr:hypothetical protein MB9_2175 [Methanobacterium formicicum]